MTSRLRSGVWLALLTASALAASNAIAADAASTLSTGVIASLVDSVLGQNLIDSFKNGAMAIASGFIPGAKIIGGALAVASLIWNLMMAQAESRPAMPVAIESVVFAALTAALLTMYSTIVSGVMSLGSWATSQAGASLGTAVNDLFGAVLAAIGDGITVAFKGSSWTEFFTGNSVTVIDAVVTVALLLVALLLIVYAMVELVTVVILGPVVVGIAVAVGPLFIATLAGHWTRRWFEQWFNFFVNGAFLYALTVIVVKLLSGTFAVAMKPTGALLVGNALAIALVAAGLGKIFAAIPNMADGLFPGRTAAAHARVGGDAAKGALRSAGKVDSGAIAARTADITSRFAAQSASAMARAMASLRRG